jgi:hypothetical protein
MLPPTISIIVASVSEDRLSIARRFTAPRFLLARSAWVATVYLLILATIYPIAHFVDHEPLLAETLILAALTLGAATRLGRYSATIGLGLDCVAASQGGNSSLNTLQDWIPAYLDHTSRATLGAAILVLGTCAYVVSGARGPGRGFQDPH